ncbi:MAG: DUF4157 domain-containing protein [Phycisphaerales bacterium]
MPILPLWSGPHAPVQRKTVSAHKTVEPGTGALIERQRGTGQLLPDPVRKPMEHAIHTDFSHVRIHTDAPADTLSGHLGARAFTTGRDIFFKAGAYSPGTAAGRRLLAHELTHVVQQNAVASPVLQRQNEHEEERPRLTPRQAVQQARTDGAAALDQAIARVNAALEAMDEGAPIPQDVQQALEQFFPGDGPEFLPLLLRRIALVRRIIETVPVRIVFTRVSEAVDPQGALVNAGLESSRRSGNPAISVPPAYIVVYPPYFRPRDQAEPLQATRLIHECFHFAYPFVRHSTRGRENPRANANSYTGFVSRLSGLHMVRPNLIFPPPDAAELEAQDAQVAPDAP